MFVRQVLTLLINLCMHTPPNRATLMQAHAPAEYVADNPKTSGDQAVSAVQALLEYFYKCEELARCVTFTASFRTLSKINTLISYLCVQTCGEEHGRLPREQREEQKEAGGGRGDSQQS